jgi:NADH pyrophosphatase NudC (nudix superfamily)
MPSSALVVAPLRTLYGLGGSSHARLCYLGQSLGNRHVPRCKHSDLPVTSGLTVFSSGLHSHQYPRTDTAIIVGIIDQTGDKILLGRNVRDSAIALRFTNH